MLTIKVSETELFDEDKEEFVEIGFNLELEHSLVSLSKWESHFEKPFLSDKPKTNEETLWYVRAMTVTKNVPEKVYNLLNKYHFEQISEYIDAKMTATWFSDIVEQKNNREVITAEIIYYWMVQLQIPFECENWHLNRLITFIRVCNQKNAPKKKMNPREAAQQMRDLNRRRREELGTSG